MAAIKVPRMNGGDGETSYANNSLVQRTIMMKARPLLTETIEKHFSTNFPSCLNVADLGCSSGPNTLLFISEFIEIIHGMCQRLNLKSPEFQVFLNDLPGNDFNSIFKSLPAFYQQRILEEKKSCFITGVPGSFYDRLFPSKSVHFIHSSSSLQWLSQTPKNLWNNKRNIYMAKSSCPSVYKAYLEQFQRDFSHFLSLRSQEIVCGGRMFLTFVGRSIEEPWSKDCCYIFELLTKALLELVDEGLVKEADVDSFNLPYYTPYKDEVRQIILKQESFNLDNLETFDVNWDPSDDVSNKMFIFDKYQSGQNVANCIRAALEPMLASHFGDLIIDHLFARYANHVAEHLGVEKTKFVNIFISITKK